MKKVIEPHMNVLIKHQVIEINSIGMKGYRNSDILGYKNVFKIGSNR